MRLLRVRFTVRLSVVAMAIVLVLFVAVLKSPYRASHHRGDGIITDEGAWSHPRYSVRFPPAELTGRRRYNSRFQGLPAERMTLSLRIVGRGDYETLRDLGTHVSVTLSDERGKTLCEASGPLRDWTLAWIPATETGYYWKAPCRDIPFRERTGYSMTLSVDGDRSLTQPLVVIPTLEGGGNELP